MNNLENPFPSDEEVHFMTDLSRNLLAVEFGTSLENLGFDAEASYRTMMLAKCLLGARDASGWTVKFCAQALNTKPKQLKALEAGRFDNPAGELLSRYVHFLGLGELYGHWLAANADLAARLGLCPLDPVALRPADWPMPQPFVLTPNTYRLSPEKRNAMQARVGELTRLDAVFGGLPNNLLGRTAPEDARKEDAPPAIYQLKIRLQHLHPAIWRRVQVPNEIKLGQLHDVIQTVMGWFNSHLHQFRVGNARFGMTHDEFGGPLDTEDSLDENDYRLSELGLRPKSKFNYEYDFGDSWEHHIVLEKVLPPQPGFLPVCLKGARACPLEDSGGPWGYADKLAIMADPDHPEHEEIAEWMGTDFDPEAFNLKAINRHLASLAASWKSRRRPRHS